MKIRRIAFRFALVLALAAVLPLVAYGVWSLVTLQRGTRDSIVTGNRNVANRAADEIQRYVIGNAEILKALAASLQNTGLEQWQQDRILKDYVLQFREFREISLFDESGVVVATSRVGAPKVSIPSTLPPLVDGQWRLRSGDNKYDIVITDNKTAPEIPVGGHMEPIA